MKKKKFSEDEPDLPVIESMNKEQIGKTCLANLKKLIKNQQNKKMRSNCCFRWYHKCCKAKKETMGVSSYLLTSSSDELIEDDNLEANYEEQPWQIIPGAEHQTCLKGF